MGIAFFSILNIHIGPKNLFAHSYINGLFTETRLNYRAEAIRREGGYSLVIFRREGGCSLVILEGMEGIPL